MTIIFEATDPRGKRITCTDETWSTHVLENHPEMEGAEADVQATISAPTYSMIYQDKDYPERNIYYLKQPRDYYIKVIVKLINGNAGELVTAFITDSPKQGEALIWKPQSRA